MTLNLARDPLAGPRSLAVAGRRSVPESRMVSVAFLASALHRRWKLCAIVGLVGLMAALGLAKMSPPTPSATTTLLVKHTAGSDPARAMNTDIELARSGAVGRIAEEQLGSASGGLVSYRVAKISDDLLQITVFGSSDRAAIRWADALGAALLKFRSDELARQAEAATNALEERAASLRTELDTIGRGITDASVVAGPTQPAPAAGTALSDLLTRRAAAQQRLAGIQSQLDDRTLGSQAVVDNSHVLDPATSNPLPGRKAFVTNLLSGIIAGLALGMGIVIVQEVFRDRVRKRRDVMAATGAPVLVSLGSFPASLRTSRRLTHQRARPRKDLARAVWHLRSVLTGQDARKPSVALLSIESDGAAALTVAALATDLARDGKRVLVADFSDGSALATAFKVPPGKTSPVEIEGATGAVTLTFPAVDLASPPKAPGGDSEKLDDDADVVVALATLDPALGAWHLSGWVVDGVAVVTAGQSRAEALDAVARMLRAAGIAMHSTILVGSDPDDETVGLPVESTIRPNDTPRVRDRV